MLLNDECKNCFNKNINRNKNKILLLLSVFLFSSCASVPSADAPAWAVDMEAEFPFDKFLAQKGKGKNVSEAEAAAGRALAQYFQVNIIVEAREEAVSRGNNPTEITNIESTIRQVNIDLFAYQYTKSWYNQKERLYEIAAFINRDEAWKIFEPGVRREEASFLDMYNAAQSENGGLKRFIMLRGTQNYYNVNFAPLRSFAEKLHPVKARESFPDTDNALRGLPRLIDGARLQSAIFIDCKEDFENRISQTIESMLNNEGFRVTKNRAEATAVFSIDFNFNMTENTGSDMRAFNFTPSVQAVLTEKNEVIFSYRAPTQSRTITVTQDAGRRRSAAALVTAMEETFPVEFKQNMASFAERK
ncbi:MAG: hypothetical protein FWB86_10465 [Treponema sp.]|nr:hypothetical protein [Treponema sp.]MCL2251370.1 hypothetical protein [Treponema sp.]